MDPMFDDKFSGIGGSYVVDPKTGRRVPAGDYFAQLESTVGAPLQPLPAATADSGSANQGSVK